uniref:CASPASE_P20 domain-containing protein n=1 Tax=Macrostomum lignano TaxID=282301 RepID=A0A1I8G5V6_9PLAT
VFCRLHNSNIVFNICSSNPELKWTSKTILTKKICLRKLQHQSAGPETRAFLPIPKRTMLLRCQIIQSRKACNGKVTPHFPLLRPPQSLVGEEPAELAHVRAESGQNTLLAVGVFVQSYSTSGSTSNLPDRSGCDADFKNCREISEMLGCIKNNIYMLHGYNILKSTYSDFIKAILNSCKRHSANASSNIKIYLFISAHGSQDGFVLSDGTVVELPKLVNKLKKIASHVRVFYQACRGAYRHSVDELSTGLEGFSFEVFSFEDAATAGSSLPSLVPGCSALFASCPGHMAYSRPDTGGWMLQALHKVLEDCPRIRQTNLSSIEDFRQLANMVQRCMQDLVGGKPIKCEKTQSHGQIQFVLHLPE